MNVFRLRRDRGSVGRRTCIAGYSGSGKSTVAKLLAPLAGIDAPALVIDADIEAKKFISRDGAIIRQLVAVFGPPVMENNEMNFAFLGKMVFNSIEQLLKYNAIVHPPFLPKLRNLLDGQGDQAVILDAALVPLWGIESWFDSCIWVHASFATRVLRVKSRSSSPDPFSVENRLCIQEEVMKEPVDEPWVRLENEGRLEELERAVRALG
jgi:dephospho-CoA kinase